MISSGQIAGAVRDLGVADGDTVFVHSGMHRALAVEGRTRDQKLDTIVAGLGEAVGRGALLMPAFSYSFCRNEDFDLAETPSTGVGVLPEHFRRMPHTHRTTDPLFSVGVTGTLPGEWERPLFAVRDVDCFGTGSVFDFLHEANAKLLFFGVPATACTFAHYVEQQMEVPYRYFKDFHGRVHAGGHSTDVTARFYVRDLEADVETYLAPLGDDLLRAGRARAMAMDGGPSLYLTDAVAVFEIAAERVSDHPDYLLRRGHPKATHLYPLLAP